MTSPKLVRAGVVALSAMVVTLDVPSIAAQATSSWSFTATPYAWASGLGGDVGINAVATHVDVGFSDILKHLRFAGMGAFDARKGPFLLTADAIYVSLGGDKAVAIRGASGDLTLDQRETIVEAGGGYNLLMTPIWSVDALLGARYWGLNAEIGLDPANRDARARSGARDWVDATGGARVRFNAASNVHLVADANAGDGGSRHTWRATGTATYDLSKRYGLMAGYKYLAVDYDRNGFLFDTHTNGLVIGVTFAF